MATQPSDLRTAALLAVFVGAGCTTTPAPLPYPVAKSTKRGVCANALSRADAAALSEGVSWYYNWYFESDEVYPGVDLEFYPMVWGASDALIQGFRKNVEAGSRPDYVLVLNEPNLREQAFVNPKRSAAVYRDLMAVADAAGIQVIGPHMAIGSAEGDSITAFDPIEDAEITYTFMVPYLNAFYYHLGDAETSAIGVHSYGDIHELRWLLGVLEENYPGKAIWVTEFAWWDAQSEAELIEFMTEAVALFEETPSVAKYAWFKARLDYENRRMSLLGDKPGQLTALGRTYVSLPF